MQQVRQPFIDYIQQSNTCFLGGMYFPHSPGHMLSELDNFLRMRKLGEISNSRSYLGVFKPSILNLPVHLNNAFPAIFGSTTGLQLIEDETLFHHALELQMVLPDHGVDVGLSHFKIRLDSQLERREARLHEGGGPRSPFWIVTQRMLARANMEWYRRRAQSPDFCPWRPTPALSAELASFVGAGERPLALLHARTGRRSGADNAGVGPEPEDLYPTIAYLQQKGFRVVKFGIEPCPPEWRERGVIDYSGSPLRSFYNDICLIGAAGIALYNGTGMATLTDVLGTPMVSYGHWHLPWVPQTPRGVVVPVLMRSRANGRLQRFSEQIAYYRQSTELWEMGNAINFPKDAYESVAPDSGDILAAVEEALSLADATIPARSELQERYVAMERNGYYKYCRSRISQAFLERYRDALDEGFVVGPSAKVHD